MNYILDCSRFWECSFGFGCEDERPCMWECGSCGGPSGPEMCNGQWALSFDPQYQYPVGPACDWPVNVDCKMK